jgi:hypothetical protein
MTKINGLQMIETTSISEWPRFNSAIFRAACNTFLARRGLSTRDFIGREKNRRKQKAKGKDNKV